MKINKVKRRGEPKLEGSPLCVSGASVLLHGILEGYYADTEPWVGISANNRMMFSPRTWEKFKADMDEMFEAVKKERGM